MASIKLEGVELGQKGDDRTHRDNDDLKQSIETHSKNKYLHPNPSDIGRALKIQKHGAGSRHASTPPMVVGSSEREHDEVFNETERRQRKRSHSDVLPDSEGESRGRQRKRVFLSPRPVEDPTPDYRELLNGDITDAALGQRWQDEPGCPLNDSQVGTSFWSAEHKRLFFDALTKYGRDALPDIAIAVGKSQPEVRQYLLLLEDGLIEHKRKYTKGSRMQPHEFPAAVEVSGELEEALEAAADDLEIKRRKFEEKEEKDKWDEYWLLDKKMAADIQRQYEIGEEQEVDSDSEDDTPVSTTDDHHSSSISGSSESEPEEEDKFDDKGDDILEHVPTARLLHLQNFLGLAEHLFMNSREIGSNWQDYSTKAPSIRHTAFEDFHALAVSMTRKIVSVAIYQAMSRIRTTRRGGLKSQMIYTYDVLTALGILGLKESCFDFFVDAPRRLHLDCFVFRPKSNIEIHLPYGPVSLLEAQDVLGIVQTSYLRDRLDPFARTGGKANIGQEPASNIDSEPYQTDKSDSEEISSNPDISDNERLRELYDATFDQAQSITSDTYRTKQLGLIDAEIEDERAEEQALEDYDGIVRVREETKLRAIVKLENAESVASAKGGKVKQTSIRPSRMKSEHAQRAGGMLKSEHSNTWRDWTEYRAPWEMHSLFPRNP